MCYKAVTCSDVCDARPLPGSMVFARRPSHSASSPQLMRRSTASVGAFCDSTCRTARLVRNVFDRGVFRFDTPAENESIIDAALMAGPEAVASHVTALRLHNLTDLLSDADEFTLPRSRRSRRPPAPLKFHFTSTPLLDAEITTMLGVRVTTPEELPKPSSEVWQRGPSSSTSSSAQISHVLA